MSGAEMIAAERERQVSEEGWTAEHDAAYQDSELVSAALAYLMHVEWDDAAPDLWPWHPSWWKPSLDPKPNLVKAGALIAAEIDRLAYEATTGTEGEGA